MQSAIPLYDALLGANVPADKAKAAVEALAAESLTMNEKLVLKSDLTVALDLLESRLTVKLGAMLFAAVGLTVTLTVALLKAF